MNTLYLYNLTRPARPYVVDPFLFRFIASLAWFCICLTSGLPRQAGAERGGGQPRRCSGSPHPPPWEQVRLIADK